MAIPKKELEFNMNDDQMRLKISNLQRELNKIAEGGGQKRIEKLHTQGKLTARERLDLLFDPKARTFLLKYHIHFLILYNITRIHKLFL